MADIVDKLSTVTISAKKQRLARVWPPPLPPFIQIEHWLGLSLSHVLVLHPMIYRGIPISSKNGLSGTKDRVTEAGFIRLRSSDE